jgi:hypothetical protein
MFDCFKCGRSGNALDLWWARATRQTIDDAHIDLSGLRSVPLPTLERPHNREEEPIAASPYPSRMPSPEMRVPMQKLTRPGDSANLG